MVSTGEPVSPEQNQQIIDDACEFVKKNKRQILERFAGDAFPVAIHPISVFMAGSPGAGKTEFSKSLIEILQNTMNAEPVVRIDGDEIRVILPGYTGSNSSIFQRPISAAVSKLHDFVLAKKKNFILDGTFSHIDQARENVSRSLSHGRKVIIVYVYQDPLVAWRFTQSREAKEGRSIPRGIFIEQFFLSRKVVQTIKDEFGDRVDVWLIEKNLETRQSGFNLNITKIDSHIKVQYSKEGLEKDLPE